MQKDDKIYIAGHRGLVGSAIVRKLQQLNFSNVIARTRQELDLFNQQKVEQFFATEKPDYVFLAAAKVGGIWANKTLPAEFIYENLLIQNNIIHAAYKNNVKKLLFLGSSCIYPKNCPQPIDENYLLSDYLEPSNEPYAIAKIAGVKMCQAYHRQYNCNFISVMPTNLYGPNDNYDLNSSHVLPALIRKFHEAKMNNETVVTVWGTGAPLREFLHVDDLADACVFLMQNYNSPEIINIGYGEDISIMNLAYLIKKIIGFNGELIFDISKPDGTPRKLLECKKINELGWKAAIDLERGITTTYQNFLNEQKHKLLEMAS